MNAPGLAAFAALPKAELHLHLEGAIAPETVVLLAARHGVSVSAAEATARYRSENFAGFLEAYKWVTGFLREPGDYALIAEKLFAHLCAQNVIYAEITLSVGVMLRRSQDVAKNFAALQQSAGRAAKRGLRIQWIFDAVRQFGSAAALEAARWAARLAPEGVVAFGVGGDELALPARDLRPAYDFARAAGLHAVAHAGEIGGPEVVREAIEHLGAERIGHGIAVMHDPALMDSLAASALPLEICPTSNLRTGALARQLSAQPDILNESPNVGRQGAFRARTDGSSGHGAARVVRDGPALSAGKHTGPPSPHPVASPPVVSHLHHPLKKFFDRRLRVVLATDDPAIFETNLLREYELAASLGFSPQELLHLAQASFEAAFLPAADRQAFLARFRKEAAALGLL